MEISFEIMICIIDFDFCIFFFSFFRRSKLGLNWFALETGTLIGFDVRKFVLRGNGSEKINVTFVFSSCTNWRQKEMSFLNRNRGQQSRRFVEMLFIFILLLLFFFFGSKYRHMRMKRVKTYMRATTFNVKKNYAFIFERWKKKSIPFCNEETNHQQNLLWIISIMTFLIYVFMSP